MTACRLVLAVLSALAVLAALAPAAHAQLAVTANDNKAVLVNGATRVQLRDTGQRIKVGGGPAAVRTADR